MPVSGSGSTRTPGSCGTAGALVVHGEHGLEQRVAAQFTVGIYGLDEPFEGHVVVVEGRQDAFP